MFYGFFGFRVLFLVINWLHFGTFLSSLRCVSTVTSRSEEINETLWIFRQIRCHKLQLGVENTIKKVTKASDFVGKCQSTRPATEISSSLSCFETGVTILLAASQPYGMGNWKPCHLVVLVTKSLKQIPLWFTKKMLIFHFLSRGPFRNLRSMWQSKMTFNFPCRYFLNGVCFRTAFATSAFLFRGCSQSAYFSHKVAL